MKKMILTPKKDTVTFCLPSDWVGKPLICILKSPYEKEEEENVVSYVSEAAICYSANRFRNSKFHRRMRRKGGWRRRRTLIF